MSVERDRNGNIIFDESRLMDGLAFVELVNADDEEDADVIGW